MNKECIGCPGCGKCQVCGKPHTTTVFDRTKYCSKPCFNKFGQYKNTDFDPQLIIDTDIIEVGKNGSELKQIALKKKMENIMTTLLQVAKNGNFKLTFPDPIPKELAPVLNLKQIQVSEDLKTLSW
jgi:hypothetical protein